MAWSLPFVPWGFGWGRGRGWRGGGWGFWSMWPGRGPFSHLPPWLRPGWLFGRGACRWLFGFPWITPWYFIMPFRWYLPFYIPPYMPYPYYWYWW